MTSLPKAMRRAVLTAKTLATAIAPEFKRTPLATGGPVMAYHGTKEPIDRFDASKTVDGAFHFGSTPEQAAMRVSGEGKHIMPVRLNIKNPRRSRDMGGNWKGKIAAAKKAGHDGIVYLNRYEGIPTHRIEALSNSGHLNRLDGLSDSDFKNLVPEATDSYIAFHPDQISSAIGKASGGAVDGDDAPDDDSPYYSPLAQGLKGAKLETGPAAYWRNTISKLPGAAEAKDTGLHDFIDSQGGDIQKQALLEHLAMNSPQLQEHWFEEDPKRKLHENRPRFTDHTLDGGTNHKELSINLPPSPGAGGSRLDEAQKLAEEAGDDWEALGPNQRQHYEDLASPRAHVSEKDFLSPPGHRYGQDRPHHADVNRIAHVRMNDRRGPKGEKLLHIDELQSDWHQKGREHGYASQKYQYRVINKASGNESQAFNTEAEAREYLNKLPESLRGRVSIKHGVVKTGGVPNAPLKDTKQWTELALRRAIKHAADNGYHGVTWTTGDQQADRYDLSKHIDEIRSDPWTTKPGWRTVNVGLPKDGHGIEFNTDEHGKVGGVTGYGEGEEMAAGWRGKHISDVLGKDIGKQIIESDKPLRISGSGLRVGGEGMRKFYDEIVPSVANKIGREHGVQAGMTHIGKLKGYSIVPDARNVHHLFPDEDPDAGPIYSSVHRDAVEKHRDMLRDADSKVHFLPVTPSMAGKKVRKYRRGGTVKPELGPAMMIAANVLNRKKRGQ